jgi:hypothetical protein
MPVRLKVNKQKFFVNSEPIGTLPDLNKGITSRLEVYNLVKQFIEDARAIPFEIDFLQVSRVWDKKEEIEEDISKFGMVNGKFIYSQSTRMPTPVRAYPVDVDNLELPIPGEIVCVIKYWDKNYYFDKISIEGASSNFDPALGKTTLPKDIRELLKERIKDYDAPKKPIKRPYIQQGSKTINSRYGSSILFDHNGVKPTIRLSNNQSQVGNSPYFESKFYTEGSTILIDSGTTEPFPRPSVQGVKEFVDNHGDKVIINSNQLIFQAKRDNIHINTPKTLYLNAPSVYIGNEPATMAESLSLILEDICDLIDILITGVSATPQGNPAMGGAMRPNQAMKSIRKSLNNKEFHAIPDKHSIKQLDEPDILAAEDLR